MHNAQKTVRRNSSRQIIAATWLRYDSRPQVVMHIMQIMQFWFFRVAGGKGSQLRSNRATSGAHAERGRRMETIVHIPQPWSRSERFFCRCDESIDFGG